MAFSITLEQCSHSEVSPETWNTDRTIIVSCHWLQWHWISVSEVHIILHVLSWLKNVFWLIFCLQQQTQAYVLSDFSLSLILVQISSEQLLSEALQGLKLTTGRNQSFVPSFQTHIISPIVNIESWQAQEWTKNWAFWMNQQRGFLLIVGFYNDALIKSSLVNFVLVNLKKSIWWNLCLVDQVEFWGRRRAQSVSQCRHSLRGSLSARPACFWRVFCKQEDEKWANVSCSGRPFQTHRRLLLLSTPIGAISLRLPWG